MSDWFCVAEIGGGKYYSTEILYLGDHFGTVCTSKREDDKPSERWIKEKGQHELCDSHWESQRDYVEALTIVQQLNGLVARMKREGIYEQH